MVVDFANPDADQQHIMAEMNAGFQRQCDECDRVCWDEEDGSCDKLAAKDEEIRNANERATEWEGIAAGRLAELKRARAAIKRGTQVLMGMYGQIVRREQDDLKTLGVGDGDAALVAKVLGQSAEDKARIATLEKTLRFIEHVDKTPFYGCSGTQADRDRYGQLPKKSGQRWMTPREMVKNLKLPG